MSNPPRLAAILFLVTALPLPASAATFSEVPDDEMTWCTLELSGGVELRAPRGGYPAESIGIVLREVIDADPTQDLFLELEFVDGKKLSYTGAVDEDDEVPVFPASPSLLTELTHARHWTYRLDQRQAVDVDEQLPQELARGFERCMSQK